MTNTIRADSISQAKAVINERIKSIDQINEKFRTSYTDYTDSTGEQKEIAIVLSLVTLVLLLLSPAIVREICSLVGLATSSPQGTIGIIALYTICLFAGLNVWKICIRLGHISQIDGYIAETTKFKDSLSQLRDNIDSTIDGISRKIEGGNVTISPETNYDNQIDKYLGIAEAYHADGNSALDHAINAFYWISSIAFLAAFIAIAASPTAMAVCNVFDVSFYEVILVAYVVISIGAFIWVNVELHKKSKNGGAGGFFSSIACAPAGLAAVWAICGIIALVIYAFIIGFVIAIIIGLIGALFNS